MLLTDIFQRALIDTGQFLISQETVELRIDNFALLVQRCLGYYSRRAPLDAWIYVNVASSRQFTFDPLTYPGQIPATLPQRPPDLLCDFVPIRISGVYPFYLRDYDRPKSNLDIKTDYPAVYRKPIWTVPISGEYNVQVAWHHVVEQAAGQPAGTMEVRTISDDDSEFLDLVSARFGMALGMNRGAFTLQPLTLRAEANTMIDWARDAIVKAEADINNNKHKFYLTWG